MAYVPPHLRNKKTEEPVKKDVVLRDEDFPALGGGGSARRDASNLTNGSFADQALRWKEKREQDDYEQRVKKELDAMRAEKKRREMLEERVIRASLPQFNSRMDSTPTPRVVHDSTSPAPANEWEVAGDKEHQKHLKYLERKERERLAKLNKEELSEESGSSQNDEEIWPAEDAY